MHNVSSAGALTRRSRERLQWAFVLVAAGVFIAVVGVALHIINFAVPGNSAYPLYNFTRVALLVIGGLIGLAGLALAASAAFTKTDNDLALVTGTFLAKSFGPEYWFVRNVNKRGLGYIDAVLVGPPGALVFRIINKTGSFANERANWLELKPDGQWSPARMTPTEDAVVDIKALRAYLTKHELDDVPVYGVVVFTQDEPRVKLVDVVNPVVPPTTLSQLTTALANNYLANADRIGLDTVQDVVNLIYDK